jgi:membrane-bound metal-dependent hydrolase YbcI (DUF457 family)
MFIGHFAVGLGTKKAAPEISLGMLLLAAQALDLILSILQLLTILRGGIHPERSFLDIASAYYTQLTHSLVMAMVWATVFVILYKVFRKGLHGAVWIWLLVVSHWALDVIAHRPGIPLYPGSRIMIGLGLEDSFLGTIATEGLLFGLGAFFYSRCTRPADKLGIYGFWALLLALVLGYSALLASPAIAKIPLIATTKARYSGIWLELRRSHLFDWVGVYWGFWLDRHRQVVVSAERSAEVEVSRAVAYKR